MNQTTWYEETSQPAQTTAQTTTLSTAQRTTQTVLSVEDISDFKLMLWICIAMMSISFILIIMNFLRVFIPKMRNKEVNVAKKDTENPERPESDNFIQSDTPDKSAENEPVIKDDKPNRTE